ncbi:MULTISPECIES: hypothetical protein [Kamptonema]|nr:MULTISPECIES: hypothetical protein [Kamptonema]
MVRDKIYQLNPPLELIIIPVRDRHIFSGVARETEVMSYSTSCHQNWDIK